ncbi:MAG: MFS transporter [Caulobacterales bacterium]|uniref:MFS transporter n=1 Tax=Glycocaulis sp. TaxID=1969725 RepID=UPI003FA0F12B
MTETDPREAGRVRFGAVLSISFGTGLLVMDNTIVTIALPAIAADLDVGRSTIILVVTLYQLTLLMALLPFSALGDVLGHRRLYQGGQALFLVATIGCFLADSFATLVIARTLQALGVAAALSVSIALIRRIYPPRLLGRGLGLNALIVASAAALAPALGGYILSLGSWRWVFAVAVPLACISLAASRLLPRPAPVQTGYDAAGALMTALMFGLLIGGLEVFVHGGPPAIGGVIMLTGVIIAAAVIRRESRRPRPVLPVDLLGNPGFSVGALATLTAFMGSMCFMLYLPFRLQDGYGLSPGEAGAVIAAWPLTMMLVGPLAGAMSDRAPKGLLGASGMALTTLALVSMATLPDEPGYLDFAWRLMLGGAGFGLFMSPNSHLMLSLTPADRTASAGALVSTTRLTGQTLGATLITIVFAFQIGAIAGAPLIAAGLTLISALCSLAQLGLAGRASTRR